MRIVINIVLWVLVGFLGYILYNNIKEPIAFEAEWNKRETAVIEKLEQVREAQQSFFAITQRYAKNFKELQDTLTHGEFEIKNVKEDPNDKEKVIITSTFVPAVDSVKNMGIDIPNLAFIPYTENKKFKIVAYQIAYQSTDVEVVEVSTRIGDYMGEYDDIKYQRYNDNYQPDNVRKFGDLSKPTTAGNWN